MIRQRMMVQFAILFLLLGTTMAWSQRTHKPKSSRVSEDATAESKISSRYSQEPKSYLADEHGHYPKAGGDSEEYVDSEEVKTHKEVEEAVGKEESDDTVKDDEYSDHSEKSGNKEFKAGGSSFDKHLKDHKADNKEVENVKEHDIGEKFGGEATKEHKLGKHKEKSKGHKLHGFKNVYHKEEYGDHKTFHDEFLDTDHQHNYDDHHEHQEVQGGKFSKGFKHEGKNKKYDKGDEKHEWAKEEFDGHHEGKSEKGKQASKHRHGSKKHQGEYDANVQRNKNSVRKVQKGVPPPPPYVPHGGHHGPHQAQVQSVVPHYHPHQDPVHVPSPHYKPHAHQQSHHVQYDDDGDKHSSSDEDHGNRYHNHDGHHGSHHHSHGGHHGNEQLSEENDSHEDDYHERTARKHNKHRSSTKEQLEDKSDEKFAPVAKHEPVVHRNEPVVLRNEPVVHRNEPVVGKLEPILHKQSVSPNYGIHQYRQPVFQENSHFKPSEPLKQEKFSQPLKERSHNHNHKIVYGYQPRGHNHQHHNHPSHQGRRFHHHQQQPFPRFSGFNHPRHHQSHGGHHHHHGGHKHHSHFRHTPNTYQPQPKQDTHVPKAAHESSIKPIRSDHHHRFSQKLYK